MYCTWNLQPKWRAVCLHMGVLIDNWPRRAQAGAARKRAAPSPWLSEGGNHTNPPALFHWKAPASTQKTSEEKKPAFYGARG